MAMDWVAALSTEASRTPLWWQRWRSLCRWLACLVSQKHGQQKAGCVLLIWVSAHLHMVTGEAVAEPRGRQAETDPKNMGSPSAILLQIPVRGSQYSSVGSCWRPSLSHSIKSKRGADKFSSCVSLSLRIWDTICRKVMVKELNLTGISLISEG